MRFWIITAANIIAASICLVTGHTLKDMPVEIIIAAIFAGSFGMLLDLIEFANRNRK